MIHSFFTWDAELYSVGDATLDAQHQRLLAVLNRLYGLIHEADAKTNAEGAAAVLHELTHYIVEHFSYEEQRLQESTYPLALLDQHRAEHDGFVAKIQGFEQRLYAGDPNVLAEMLPYLYGDWLVQHICGTDMGYREFLHPEAAASVG